MRIGGVDAVHVGPDHEFVSVHDVSDERSGEIRTVPAECSDAAIACGTDESGAHGNHAIFEERQKNFAATAARFVDVRARVAESVASNDKIRRAYRNSGDTVFFQRGSKQTSTEALAVRSQAIL